MEAIFILSMYVVKKVVDVSWFFHVAVSMELEEVCLIICLTMYVIFITGIGSGISDISLVLQLCQLKNALVLFREKNKYE